MFVRFIAHAGIFIKDSGLSLSRKASVIIDPWFTDSTISQPLIEEIYGHPTIDFQIPKTKEKASDYSVDAILLSHFHAHHAPLFDILKLIESSKKIIIAYPDQGEENKKLEKKFHGFSNVVLAPKRDGDSFEIGGLRIKAISHTNSGHLAWLVSNKKSSALHLTDSKFNRKHGLRNPDELWKKFLNLNPDLLFLAAGGNSRLREKDGHRYITEAAGLSPIEGAEITRIINPKVVTMIGIYNHSIWKNRQEFVPPSHYTEELFQWANDWINPAVKNTFSKPGHTFGIKELSLATSVDTFIS